MERPGQHTGSTAARSVCGCDPSCRTDQDPGPAEAMAHFAPTTLEPARRPPASPIQPTRGAQRPLIDDARAHRRGLDARVPEQIPCRHVEATDGDGLSPTADISRKVGVPERRPDGPDEGAGQEQVPGEAVPQRETARALRHTALLRCLPLDRLHRRRVEVAAAPDPGPRVGADAAHRKQPLPPKIALQIPQMPAHSARQLDGSEPEPKDLPVHPRHHAERDRDRPDQPVEHDRRLVVPPSGVPHEDLSLARVPVVHTDPDAFSEPSPRSVEPPTHERVDGRKTHDHGTHLVPREHPGQVSRLLGERLGPEPDLLPEHPPAQEQHGPRRQVLSGCSHPPLDREMFQDGDRLVPPELPGVPLSVEPEVAENPPPPGLLGHPGVPRLPQPHANLTHRLHGAVPPERRSKVTSTGRAGSSRTSSQPTLEAAVTPGLMDPMRPTASGSSAQRATAASRVVRAAPAAARGGAASGHSECLLARCGVSACGPRAAAPAPQHRGGQANPVTARPHPEDPCKYGLGAARPGPEPCMYGPGTVRPDPDACMYGPGAARPDPEPCMYGRGAARPDPGPCMYGPLAAQPGQESWMYRPTAVQPSRATCMCGPAAAQPCPEARSSAPTLAMPAPRTLPAPSSSAAVPGCTHEMCGRAVVHPNAIRRESPTLSDSSERDLLARARTLAADPRLLQRCTAWSPYIRGGRDRSDAAKSAQRRDFSRDRGWRQPACTAGQAAGKIVRLHDHPPRSVKGGVR